jgi:hypothetical protein
MLSIIQLDEAAFSGQGELFSSILDYTREQAYFNETALHEEIALKISAYLKQV